MMTAELDHGIRCETHVGEVFRPNCRECDAAAISSDQLVEVHKMMPPTDKHGYCLAHRGYASSERWPCVRCVREASGVVS